MRAVYDKILRSEQRESRFPARNRLPIELFELSDCSGHRRNQIERAVLSLRQDHVVQ